MLDKVDNSVVHIGEPYPIKVSKILPNPNQPRRYFNEASLAALANSIQNDEQKVPISVKKHPTEKGMFIILDGERRWRAHKIIWDRTGVEPTIKAFMAIVKNEKEFYKSSVIANLHKEDFTELDEAAALTKLHDDGDSIAALANMLNKSPTYVTNRIKLHTLPDEVKALMSYDLPKEQRLAVTVAIDIVLSTKNPQMQLELAKEAVQRSLGVHDTRLLIHARIPDAPIRGTDVAYGVREHAENRGTTVKIESVNRYKKLTSFLGNSRKQLTKLLDEDFEIMFFDRINDQEERNSMSNQVSNLVIDLRRLQSKIRGQS